MKLWKVLARNSNIYNNRDTPYQQPQKPNCVPASLQSMELYEYKSRSPTFSNDSGKYSEQQSDLYLTTTVQLRKRTGEALGIVLKAGNSETELCPSIATLRPGSIALTSDQLVPGDRIYSVNGINTSRMKPEDVTKLLDNVDGNAMLEIQYSLPPSNYASSQNSLCLTTKATEITLERIDGTLGITLRGGYIPDNPQLSGPLIITQIRPNGPAHRNGLVRVGDRLLKVDQYSLINKTLLEAQKLLSKNVGNKLTNLTIEYDVSIIESIKYANGPLLIEIEQPNDDNEHDFGLILTTTQPTQTNCCSNNLDLDEILITNYFIENILPASTADRCGALNIGDQILTIDDINLNNFTGNLLDLQYLLRNVRKLQILPYHIIVNRCYCCCNNSRNLSPILQHNHQQYSTLNSRRSRNHQHHRVNRLNRQSTFHSSDSSSNFYGCSSSGGANNNGVCHPETLILTLNHDHNYGYGINVSINNDNGNVYISRIIKDSPAYQCGCLQTGDRILSINHQTNLTLQEINKILEFTNDNDSILDGNDKKLILEIEFDVADTIVPSSGIFTVKLPKKHGCNNSLGITITSSSKYYQQDETFIITEIRRGSIAHRTGTIHAGDRLLSIDNQQLNYLNIEKIFNLLQQNNNDIVTLKIEKTEIDNKNLLLDSVVYTVELHRYGGPLGITISGSEDCIEPIILSRLTEGGLAEKTGALHVGDHILAINGENLDHRPLSDAIRLLQSSGDRVQLKIARNLVKTGDDLSSISQPTPTPPPPPPPPLPPPPPGLVTTTRCNYSSPGVLSVDSAVHSWDSTTIGGIDCGENLQERSHDFGDGDESILSEPISVQQQQDNRKKHDSELQFYSDTDDIFLCPSPLPLPNYNNTNNSSSEIYKINNYLKTTLSNESILDNEIYHITLYKDSIYDDYGFSVSDGLYEKGVYVNRIRKGGPADIVGLLKPYDRIIQVNDTKTKDFDCCLTVPLIASAGDRIELVIARNPYLNYSVREHQDSMSKKSFSTSQNTITKTL